MALLNNKVVIVAGSAGLLGRKFIEAISNEGGIPVQADLKLENCFPNYDAFLLDITSKESLQELISAIYDKYGRIDAFVNTAYPKGKNYGQKFEEVTYSDFCENVSLHLGGYFLAAQQFSLFFKTQGFGNIVHISSIYGIKAPRFDIYEDTDMTMPIEYAAIKAGIIHVTQYMMRYFQGYKIRFNCLCPGGIMNEQPEIFLAQYRRYAQTKGMLDAKDLQGALLFLLSDLSEFINGQNIIVDDGWIV